MTSKKVSNEYTANDFTTLEGLQAILKRPGMYIGSLDSKGMTHLTYEIIDNAVDEALAGHCNRIDITFYKDDSIEITDNGRGIPVDINTKMGLSGIHMAYTKVHSGGKFGNKGYQVSGGLHGVGAAVVNALSSRVDVTVYRNNKKYETSFQRGPSGNFATKSPESSFVPSPDLRESETTKEHTGTKVRFWPDKKVFLKDASTDVDAVISRVRQTAFLIPGLAFHFIDLRGDEKVEEIFKFAGGVKDMAEYLSPGNPICDTISISGNGTFLETVPMLDEQGHMVPKEVERNVDVQIALIWNNGYEPNINTFVNIVTTPNGGTHKKGFERALLAGLRKGYEGTRLLKANEEPPILEDCFEGLTAVVSILVPEPQFVGQTKEELGTQGVTKVVQDITAQGIAAWMDGRKKAQARIVLEKIANASKTRIASRTSRESARRKTAIEGANMPAKLVDCAENGVEESELFLVEGDSALGSAVAGRDSKYQAFLPLRGKILNVQKASLADMLNNAECAAIIQSVGAGSGRTFDIEQMRYGRIIILSDSDSDGQHIAVLLIVLFAKYMREVITQGRLFVGMAPLHKIETMGKGGEIFYTYTHKEMLEVVGKLEKSGKKIKLPMQRFKGLGEMSADELADTTLTKELRSLRKVTMDNIEESENILQLLMGDEVAPRRDWIILNSDLAKEELL